MDYHIRTEELGKIYRKWLFSSGFRALESLSIEVPAGSVMGFLGRNGAGKTTTIKLLLGLAKPTSGKAWVMGIDSRSNLARREVAYMPELPCLSDSDTPLSLLRLVGRLSRMDENALSKRIEEVLGEVGLTGRQDTSFGEFSKGMKQRAELAQALLPNPKLLILDEPFSGLDPVGRREVRDLILDYNRKKGVTVFFSSHILSDVEVMCESIGILDKGRLRAVGHKRDLLGVMGIEVSCDGLSPQGVMFCEGLCDSTSRSGSHFAVNLKPGQDPTRFASIFQKYGGTDIQTSERTRSLEDFFLSVVDSEAPEGKG